VRAAEPAYAARVSLDQTRMQIDDKLLNLSPGMAVTVEIKTGTGRIIDYLLSPILRHLQESLSDGGEFAGELWYAYRDIH
jgi:hemolysin D